MPPQGGQVVIRVDLWRRNAVGS